MKKHILVVEDDPQNALLFRKVLEKRGGFRVSVTEEPSDILRLAAQDVDLVLMDISLRNSRWEGEAITGVELCRMLKTDPRTSRIPVILATAHAMRGDAGRLMAESGADDYVAKPITDHGEFLDRVIALLERAA